MVIERQIGDEWLMRHEEQHATKDKDDPDQEES